jgi:Methyltransferase domain
MERVGAILRGAYVSGARATRSVAARSGLLDRLDRSYRTNPRSVGGHVRTLFAIHDVDDLVNLDIPWWTYGAIDTVERRLSELQGNARVFEYGSGASTVWLGNRSKQVLSVEHHAGFAQVMRRVVAQTGLTDRVELLEVAAETSANPITRSGRKGENHVDYTAYAHSIQQVGGLFDLVVVDGRARVACCLASLPYLAPGGLIVFDDAQRPRYQEGIKRSGLPVRRIWGWVPSLPYPRQTALLGPDPRK